MCLRRANTSAQHKINVSICYSIWITPKISIHPISLSFISLYARVFVPCSIKSGSNKTILPE